VGGNTEQAKLEYLEQAAGARANDHDVGSNLAQNVTSPLAKR
jgi:hypothetical protein